MGRNGTRRPPRPRIELLTPAASPQEAAAIAAAIEEFLAATAPPAPASAPRPNAWQRAALHEAVGAKAAVVSPWGEPAGWGTGTAGRA